jgi:hypothetical protein
LATILLLAAANTCFGQGATVLFPPLRGPNGANIAFAKLTFCTTPATFDSRGNCTNTVTVYKDVALTQTYSSSITTDGLGNFPPNTVNGVTQPTLWFPPAQNYCYAATGGGDNMMVSLACTPFSVSVAAGSSPSFATITTMSGPSTFGGSVTLGTNSLSAGAAVFGGSIVQNGGGSGAVDFRINRGFYSADDPANNLPMGHDVFLASRGPGDIYLAHLLATTSTTASLSTGVNSNVVVASSSAQCASPVNGQCVGTGAGAGIIVGRDTPNEENVATGNWSTVNATRMNITAARTHSGTTDIEQSGATVIQGPFIRFAQIAPEHFTNGGSPIRFVWSDNSTNSYWGFLGVRSTDPWPFNAFGFGLPLTGFSGSGSGLPFPLHADFIERNNTPSDCARLQSSSGRNNFNVCDASNLFGAPLVDATSGGPPATSGQLRLTNNHGISWRNHGNTADVSLSVTGSGDQLTYNGNSILLGTLANSSISNEGPAVLEIGDGGVNANGEIRSAKISATYNAEGTVQTAVHIVQDSCILGINCAVTLAGSAAFANASSYHCAATDATSTTAVRVNQTSGHAVTFTGTGTDVINFICVGN